MDFNSSQKVRKNTLNLGNSKVSFSISPLKNFLEWTHFRSRLSVNLTLQNSGLDLLKSLWWIDSMRIQYILYIPKKCLIIHLPNYSWTLGALRMRTIMNDSQLYTSVTWERSYLLEQTILSQPCAGSAYAILILTN